MRVTIIQIGIRFHARILDGYRTGECTRNSVDDLEFDVERDRFSDWLIEIGYDVVV